MSLVPFPAPTTATPRGASGRALPAASLPKASAAPLAGRGHATGRGDSTTAPGRAASRFAHVLAIVQEQKGSPAPTTGPECSHRVVRPSEADTPEDGLEATESSSPVVPVPVEPAGAASVQTPWLLLALGNGAHARPDEDAGESLEPPSVECFAPEAEHALAIVPVQAPVPAPTEGQMFVTASGMRTGPVGEALAAVAGNGAGSGGGRLAMGAGESARPQGGAVEMERATQPVLAGIALESDLASADGLDGTIEHAAADASAPSLVPGIAAAVESESSMPTPRADQDTVAPHGVEVPSEARSANPVAGALARWHAAARRSGGDIPPRSTVAQVTSEEVTTPRAPGLAASRLAQALGAASGQEAATPADGQSTPSIGSLPTTRAVDVLTRPAIGPRDAHEPGASMASLGQVVAAAAPASSPVPTATAASVPATPLSPAAGEQVLQQLVSSIKMQWKDGIGEAKLHLRPDALGAVSVSLRVESGAVTAVVRAESAQVQEWVLQHQQTLRQQMEAAGLRLDELVVSPDDQRQQSRQESSPEPRQRRPRGGARGGDQQADAPRFELLA